MEKKNINKMILLMFFCIIVYNLAHPATPGLIELRNWKKSISGEFLAVMSTANVHFVAVFRSASR